jgi:hypothetical protein
MLPKQELAYLNKKSLPKAANVMEENIAVSPSVRILEVTVHF